ncbi:phosphotransferase [bacterium]|nr:phosphotransferase [bacterium]
MEKSTRKLFTKTILSKALNLYDIQPETAQILDGFESFIYNVRKDGQDLILRIGHDGRRSVDMVQGEAEFLNHLAHGGLSVARVLPSKDGRLAETIPAADGSHFVMTLFTKAPGHVPTLAEWKSPLFKSMGVFMGKLHALSKTFQPSQPRYRRFDIEADFNEMIETAKKHLPPGDGPVLAVHQETLAKIRQLPKGADSYGLCHIDFHNGNFFLTDEGQITLFDFDDCQYAWYIYDVAMALFYALPNNHRGPEELYLASTFLTKFWSGYRTANDLDPAWLAKIPLFLKLREMDLYIVIHRSMDMDNLDPWCAGFMAGRREKILNRTTFIDLDFEQFAMEG